jgi:protein-S-isoprenylcysteine O-methyltransferase Ste14
MDERCGMATQTPWWRGARGEYWVIAQGVLFVLIAVGPRTAPRLPAWPPSLLGTVTGLVLMLIGGALSVSALVRLGPNLTPLPYPKDDSTLVETGPYAIVRHPIYSGLILGGFGWAITVHSLLTLAYAIGLLVFFDLKSRREERWLSEKFAGYAGYRMRVRKLVPFVY